MKKVLVLLGILCLLIFSLSACSSSAPEGETDETAVEESTDTMGSGAEEAAAAADEAGQQSDEAAGEATE